jgi:hypothetical protein
MPLIFQNCQCIAFLDVTAEGLEAGLTVVHHHMRVLFLQGTDAFYKLVEATKLDVVAFHDPAG